MKKRAVAIIIAAALFLVPAGMNIPLGNYYYSGVTEEKADIIYRIFGSLRGMLADWAFMKGESYYHGGLPVATIMEQKVECLREEMAGIHDEEAEAPARAEKQAPWQNLFLNLYAGLKTTRHIHLSGKAEREVLPWFYLEVKFDPRDIQGWTLGAYWLRRNSMYAEALRFLREGERKNPDSARIKTMLGDIFFRDKEYGEALVYLEQARRLWNEGKPLNSVADDYAATDRALAFTLLAGIYRMKGDREEVLKVAGEFARFEPGRAEAMEKTVR